MRVKSQLSTACPKCRDIPASKAGIIRRDDNLHWPTTQLVLPPVSVIVGCHILQVEDDHRRGTVAAAALGNTPAALFPPKGRCSLGCFYSYRKLIVSGGPFLNGRPCHADVPGERRD